MITANQARKKLRTLSAQIRRRNRIPAGINRVAYLGALGERNLGDEAMYHALRASLPGRALIPLQSFSYEQMLAKLNLSGYAYFGQAILGGGTLISPHWLNYVKQIERWQLSLMTAGTGVGSSGFGEEESELMEAWVPHLQGFRGLGLRGPRSEAKLRAAGLPNAVAIGDLAHLFAGRGTGGNLSSKKLAINITLPPGETYAQTSYASLKQLEPVVGELVGQGWDVVAIAMHPRDAVPTKQFLFAATGRPYPVELPRTYDNFAALVRDCTCTFSVRLHGAILSTCTGTPALMLGYRDKCADFMEAMALEDWYVDLSIADGDGIVEKAKAITVKAPELRSPVLDKALEWRQSLEGYFQEHISQY